MDFKKNWNKILGLLLIVVLVYWAVNNLTSLKDGLSFVVSAFIPFIIGGALAFILNIPLKEIEKLLVKLSGEIKKWHRFLAIFLSFSMVALFFYLLFFLIIPDLEQTITSFLAVVPNTVRSSINWVSSFIDNNPRFVEFVGQLDIDINQIQQEAISTIQKFATNFIGGTLNLALSLINSVVTIFIAIVFAVYILSMKETLVRQVKKIVYGLWSLKWANYIINVGAKANAIFSSFVGGQIIEAIILGLLVYAGMWIFSFPYRLSVSAIIGALALIPIYGAIIGGLVGFILIAVVSIPKAFAFILFIVVVQQIEGNIIYPRVVGNSVGLPGVWVMMVVTVGGSLFGLVGMLVAVPVTSLIYSLVVATINHRLEIKNLLIQTTTNNVIH